MDYCSIEREAAAIADGIAALKADAMHYQADAKRRAMAAFGLSWAEVNLPYAQWAEIRRKLVEHERASRI